jgi:hypothetical protein
MRLLFIDTDVGCVIYSANTDAQPAESMQKTANKIATLPTATPSASPSPQATAEGRQSLELNGRTTKITTDF